VHDSFSYASVFDSDIKDREKAFIKAEAIRFLISELRNTMGPDDRKSFDEAVLTHCEAYGKGLFYNRNLNFEE
jgi:hypothetical protein